MKETVSKGVSETQQYAEDFVNNIVPIPDGATVVCLFGDLGSGKTTFVKTAAKTLGVTEIVTSPTFVIEKKYKIENPKFDTIYHIDAYRLKSGSELLALGWNEILKNNKNIVFIEWPKYVMDVLPPNLYKLTFTFVDDNTRKIELEE